MVGIIAQRANFARRSGKRTQLFTFTLLPLIFLGSVLKPSRSKIKKKIPRPIGSTWQRSALNFSVGQDFVGNAAEGCKEGRTELEQLLERAPACLLPWARLIPEVLPLGAVFCC